MAALSKQIAVKGSARDILGAIGRESSIALDLFEQHPLFISVCTRDVGPALLHFLHALFAQSLAAHKVHLCITYLGSAVGPVRALQKIQRNLEGHLRGFDVTHVGRGGEAKAHANAVAGSEEPFILLLSDDIILDGFALERLMHAVKQSPSEVALWELRQARQAGHETGRLDEEEYGNMVSRCVLYRRAALEKVGGVSVRELAPKMEMDLAYRLRDSGYRAMQCREVMFRRYESGSEMPQEQPFEAWLSDHLVRLRYGTFDERTRSLMKLSANVMVRPRDAQSLMMRTILREIGRRPSLFVWGRLPPGLFPLCGRREELMAAPRIQPHYAWLLDKDQPLVSVIVRTGGNPRGFLCETLRSIANQTYPHLEVITVERGDGAVAARLLSGPLFAGTETRALQVEKETSLAALAKIGIEAARGRYCLVLDDCQILFSNHVMRLARALADAQESPAAYAGVRRMAMGVLKAHPLRYREGLSKKTAMKKPAKVFNEKADGVPSCAVLFRKESFETCSAFDDDMLSDLWQQLKATERFVHVKGISAVSRDQDMVQAQGSGDK